MTSSTALHSSLIVTLWPALAVMAYFIVSFVLFSARTWLHGMPVDTEVMGRPDSAMLSRFFRHFMMWLLAPWQRVIVRTGITPNMLTFASLVAAFGAGAAASVGRFALGGWLYFLCGILDILDGRVARIRNQVSPAGAFFDSVIDRYAELFVFGGMAIYFKDSWAIYAVLLASLGSVMVSYTRARGESLGVTNLNIGLMQRPERLVYLGMSMIWSPLVEGTFGHGPLPAHALVVGGLVLLAVSTNLTAVRRIQHTMRILEVPVQVVAAPVAIVPMAVVVEAPRPERSAPAVSMLPLRVASRSS